MGGGVPSHSQCCWGGGGVYKVLLLKLVGGGGVALAAHRGAGIEAGGLETTRASPSFS